MGHKTSGPIMVVLGTRPEIVKLAHITRNSGDQGVVVHTGQHYDTGLSGRSSTSSGSRNRRSIWRSAAVRRYIGLAVTALDEIFAVREPAAVVVQGDTNTVLAAALAANAREIPIVHVEAGLRSNDRRMPEEHNRVVTDHLADLLLAPTEGSRRHSRGDTGREDRRDRKHRR